MKIFGKKKYSLPFIAFWQALGVVAYCGLIGLLFWRGEQWFGEMSHYFGPVFFLTLFSASALICALLVFGYPFILFWEEKQTIKALKLVIYTAAWLAFFALLFIIFLTAYQYLW